MRAIGKHVAYDWSYRVSHSIGIDLVAFMFSLLQMDVNKIKTFLVRLAKGEAGGSPKYSETFKAKTLNGNIL